MHLDQPVVVGGGAVDDDEDEVVVVVDLRPLAEVLRVLDRQRVEPEDVAEDLEVARLRLVEVEPEEAAAREQLLDRLAAELNLAAALLVEDVADRPVLSRPGRRAPASVVLHAAIVLGCQDAGKLWRVTVEIRYCPV